MKYSTRQIRALRESGRTLAEIREIIGCCNETIRRAMADDIDEYRRKERERVKRYRGIV